MKYGDLQKFYDKDAEDYKFSRWERNPIMQFDYQCTKEAIEKVLQNVSGENVLEIGCGPGTWTEFFVKKFNHVDVVEISENMIRQARMNATLEEVVFFHSDFLSFHSKHKYDIILSIRSFEYASDKELFLRKTFELLNPGGHLVIITKTIGSYWYKRTKIRNLLYKMLPKLFRYEKELEKNNQESHKQEFWQERVFVRKLKKLLMTKGLVPVYHRPVIIRPPIFMRGKSEIPLVPPVFEHMILAIFKVLNFLFKSVPQATILAESFLVVSKKTE